MAMAMLMNNRYSILGWFFEFETRSHIHLFQAFFFFPPSRGTPFSWLFATPRQGGVRYEYIHSTATPMWISQWHTHIHTHLEHTQVSSFTCVRACSVASSSQACFYPQSLDLPGLLTKAREAALAVTRRYPSIACLVTYTWIHVDVLYTKCKSGRKGRENCAVHMDPQRSMYTHPPNFGWADPTRSIQHS